MSLYVRVLTNFYSHRKTLRLKAAIGDAAFWVPPRLWAYAAEHQPDGCFKDYSAEELAMLIGYSRNAQALLQALVNVGFMDENPLRVHDWQEHAAYHSAFSDRAKKAAAVRWAKNPPAPPEKDIDKTRQETSIASSNAQASRSEAVKLVFDSWNAIAQASGLPQCLLISDKRRRTLEIRLREPFFESKWKEALEKVVNSKFCKGESDRGWRATFDWFIQPDSVTKIMEGKYDTGHIKTPQRANPRNLGICKPSTGGDYGEAAKRKLERQALEAQHRAASEAQGNGTPSGPVLHGDVGTPTGGQVAGSGGQ